MANSKPASAPAAKPSSTPNPNYPSTNYGKPSGTGRGNTPKSK